MFIYLMTQQGGGERRGETACRCPEPRVCTAPHDVQCHSTSSVAFAGNFSRLCASSGGRRRVLTLDPWLHISHSLRVHWEDPTGTSTLTLSSHVTLEKALHLPQPQRRVKSPWPLAAGAGSETARECTPTHCPPCLDMV